MPKPDESSDGLKRLDNQLDAFEASRTTRPLSMGMGGGSGSDGFRMLGSILGGVLGGLGLGWLVDHFAGTAPLGVLSGLLIGAVLSVIAAVRQATAMSAKAAAAGPPARAVADDDDDDDEPDGASVG
jgi:ATP synthase protein I